MPRAMAPLVTRTTSRPCPRSAAAWEHTSASTSRRTSPRSSATMLEPSLITIGGMPGRILGAERRAGVELEHRAGDLHVVPGRESRRLEALDHAERAQPLLDVRERVGVVDVVSREQALHALPADPERLVAHALDDDLLCLGRPVDAVFGEDLRRAGDRGRGCLRIGRAVRDVRYTVDDGSP